MRVGGSLGEHIMPPSVLLVAAAGDTSPMKLSLPLSPWLAA
jgi:hypothetical protein